MIIKEQLQTMSEDEIFDTLGDLADCYIRRSSPCEDIMPLAFEHGVYYYNGTACAAISDFIDGHVVFDEPYYFDAGRQLRAIACCLILILQEKQNG